MKDLFSMMLLLLSFSGGFGQVNVQLLHQLVSESKSEHSRQLSARDKQAIAAANEHLNAEQTASFKDNFRKIQSRFHTLGMAIDLSQISMEALPLVEEISRQQQSIFKLCSAKPALVLLALDTQADLLDKAHSLLNYLYALNLEAGVLARMKPSERKLLFAEVLSQLRGISGSANGLLSALKNASKDGFLKGAAPFGGFLNQDRRIIENIIRQLNHKP